jgi:hypothetical protein
MSLLQHKKLVFSLVPFFKISKNFVDFFTDYQVMVLLCKHTFLKKTLTYHVAHISLTVSCKE